MGRTPRAPESSGADEPRGVNRNELQSILRCPSCHTDLSLDLAVEDGARPTCQACGRTFSALKGVPILLREEREVAVAADDHISHDLPEAAKELLTNAPGLTLNVGGGATREVFSGCVEVEYALFAHTTVVADVHELPFVDQSFAAVVSMNAFEHFARPDEAAKELYRVLRPGGRFHVHTAFLQPLHEAPHHYFNATEYGVREWFGAFEIEDVSVSPNFSPNYTLAWLAHEILWWVNRDLGTDAQRLLASSRLGDWGRFWELATSDPSAVPGEIWEILRQLPDVTQARFAAGFEIRGHKQSTRPVDTA